MRSTLSSRGSGVRMLLILAVVSIAGCGTVLAANPQPTPEPAPSASITPSETPAATTPTDTPSVVGPVTAVTATVADRIPASLQGRAWAAVGPTALFAGSLGDPVRLRLPPSWDLLAITDEYVVTGQRALDGSSTLVNFSFRGNGAADRKPVSVPGQMIAGVVASDRLYVTGFDATSTGDPGVIAISMLDGTVTIVVPPAPAPEGLGSPVARNVLVSPSGRTVLSSLCSPAGCSGGTIVDASTASVRGSLANTDGPSAINESFALVRRGGDITTEIALVDLSSGAERWRQRADEYAHAYLTDDDDVVILLSRVGTAMLARISRDGVERDFGPLLGRLPSLWVDQSTTSLAVIGDGGPFPGGAGADGVVRGDVFDLDAWVLRQGAIEIDIDGQP